MTHLTQAHIAGWWVVPEFQPKLGFQVYAPLFSLFSIPTEQVGTLGGPKVVAL